MDAMTQLKPKLSRLKLSGILSNLDLRLSEAQEQKRCYSDFLLSLFQDEVERRDTHALALRIKRGNLSLDKTLESFDFTANPKINVPVIKELATCQFLKRSENVIFVGPSGVGKSHLAEALGHEAARRGYDVFKERSSEIIAMLAGGRGDGTFMRKLRYLTSVALLIIDDLGLTNLTAQEQMDFYELICGRYELKSTIITSNRDVSEWLSVFDNPLLGSAAVDRLVHRAVRIAIEGESYRVREAVKLNRKYADLKIEK